MRYARIGQIYYQAFTNPPTIQEARKAFFALDRNFDNEISPDEAGLSTVLALLGPSAQMFIVPMNTLWAAVSLDVAAELGAATFVAYRSKPSSLPEEKEIVTE